ncbi:hypothetical protein GOP47_0012606 [Adiantum capillus-veneris]|uniref:UBC core domain-containing protein n=1 Tax=Adiantum capillus-veneris TaxID=13818 RepID=A0A9D4URC4_ADICA|nr:hypothetical protein GOP47_0012606 [Adiantum capillus-veneris]
MEADFSLFKRKQPSKSSTSKGLSKVAALRIQSEAHEWLMNPPSEFEYTPTDDLRRWIVQIFGAPGTLYADEMFNVQFDFTDDYPMEAPEVIFLSPVPLHPHIYSNGHICLDILYDKWSPALSVSSVSFSLLSMLSSCTKKERPPGNDLYVRRCFGGRSPKEANWHFHDDKVLLAVKPCDQSSSHLLTCVYVG